MTDKPGVYDFAAIAQYAKQQEAEKMANIMGRPLEDAKPVEAPADIDWTGMYGYPCGYVTPGQFTGIPTGGTSSPYGIGRIPAYTPRENPRDLRWIKRDMKSRVT